MGCFSIGGVPVKACFEALSDKTLRISLLPAGESVKDVFATLDLAERSWNEPGQSLTDACKLRAGNFEIDAKELRFSVRWNGKPVQTIAVDPDSGHVQFPLGAGRLFGLGHGYKQHLDRRGFRYDLRVNGQVPEIMENHSANSPSPYVISTEGWALFFHQPWKGAIDLRGEVGCFEKYPAAYADIFVVALSEPADAAREYYAFTGMPPMPPKYAFGYQQSYRTLVHNGVNQVVKTAKYMREHDLPCDLLVYLGTGYCDYGWNTWNGNFEWHPDVFPNPAESMRELHDMHYKVSLHVTKCFTGLHGSVHDEEVSPLEYDHAKNYWKRHEELYEVAQNEAWWPDDADEVDMEQRLARWRMYYEGSLRLNPDVRPLQMQRNAFPGHTKWGGIIWSGDVLAEWETLKNQVPIGLNVGMSCSPFWGTDTGGFFSTIRFTGELFARWFEYSAFTPFFRGHGRPSFLHNPWGWTEFTSLDQIPLERAKALPRDSAPPEGTLPDARVEPICRKYLHARYELMPYFYSLAMDVHVQGLPMMRPLWFLFPGDEKACGIGSEYLLGDSLLVAPVTAKGATKWDVYLPEGIWYDYFKGTRYEGGEHTVEAALEDIPVFARAGAILPKAPVAPYVDTGKKDGFDELSLAVYQGADGEYALYEDDGISLGYLRKEYTRTVFRWDDAAGALTATGESTMFPGMEREIRATILPEGRELTVRVRY